MYISGYLMMAQPLWLALVMAQPFWLVLVMAQPLQLACQVAVLGNWVLPAAVCSLWRMMKRPQESAGWMDLN